MRLLSAFVLILVPVILVSQDIAKESGKIYGLDPLLYNGRKYTYFIPAGAEGHPYLHSPEFIPGSVTIKGKTYRQLLLNYDIYHQELLLQFVNSAGAADIIEVSKAWLEGFALGSQQFEYLGTGNGPRFFQVAGTGNTRILFYHKKDFKLDASSNPATFRFVPARKEGFVTTGEGLFLFRNNRDFTGIFPLEKRADIKNYLRQHRINVKTASDTEITGLADFISKLD